MGHGLDKAQAFLLQIPAGKAPYVVIDKQKCFVFKGVFLVTSIWYRFNPSSTPMWEWTPDKENWMPVTTIVVSGGYWKGEVPALCNVFIIRHLAQGEIRPPPDQDKPKKVELDLDIAEWAAEEKLSEITDFEVIRDHFVTSFPDFHKHLTTVHDKRVNKQERCPHDAQVYSQHGGTCWAHACADGVIAARKRIIGSPPISHAHLAGALVYCYGRKGKNSSKVLQGMCKFFRLRCKKLTNLSKAIDAIKHERALVGSFYLTAKQWAAWTLYWHDKNNANIGLSKGDLDHMYSDNQLKPFLDKDAGHAVLIVGFEQGFFKIKNSWGDKWASKGYALVDPAFFHWFVDVYWMLEDLLPSEIRKE